MMTEPDYERETLQAVLGSGDEKPICHGVYSDMNTALTASTELKASAVQETTVHRGRRVEHNGHQFTFREYPARHPGEQRAVEVAPKVDVKQGYTDPRRWRYVFNLRDWTDSHRLDEDGVHATLTAIYARDEDADPAGPEGYQTVAVNGSVRVPEFIRNAILDELEIEGFGRPPFIPERDGEPRKPKPEAVVTDGGVVEHPTDTAPRIDPEAFGREWERLEEITGVQWERVFPEGVSELDATALFLRLSLGRQVTGGTAVSARKTRYEPALKVALQTGNLEMVQKENGDHVVRLPDGAEGTGWNR